MPNPVSNRTLQQTILSLDDDQRAAVTHTGSELLLLAPAGSGKSTVLGARAAYATSVLGENPSSIMALTFTTKAAGHMKRTISRLLDRDPRSTQDLWVGTQHALSARILRNHGSHIGIPRDFHILDKADQTDVLTRVILRLDATIGRFPEELRSRVEQAERNLRLGLGSDHPNDRKIRAAYRTELAAMKALDFDMLIDRVIDLWTKHPDIPRVWQNKFTHVSVDEFQDLGDRQLRWLTLLASPEHHICCVGDDDQSVYGWRGANVTHILRFREIWPNATVLTLSRNYRNPAGILAPAGRLIKNNTRRWPKEPRTANDNLAGKIEYRVIPTDEQEPAWIAEAIGKLITTRNTNPGDIAVLCRTNQHAGKIAAGLQQGNIPHALITTPVLDRLENRIALAWAAAAEDPTDDLAYLRVIASAPVLLPPATIDRIAEIARKDKIPARAIPLAYATEIGITPQQAEMLAKAETVLQNHAGDLPPSQRILAICDDPLIAPTVAPRPDFPDAIKDLSLALQEYPTVREFLAQTRLEESTFDRRLEPGVGDKVLVMTVHGAKGLEAAVVFLPGWEEGLMPLNSSPSEIEEERRLAYVAVTRAMKLAVITSCQVRRKNNAAPSRFLAELGLIEPKKAAA